jgi:diacylglycerol kinase family enzyme
MNPKSGAGKVKRYGLVEEARRRGIQPVLLGEGDDLRALAEKAVAGGADVIGMAGGDGSQAVVASVAAEHDVAFVCVPAGTRNHLALDLGVLRTDVVGALDAFSACREARIDLAVANGRVFVNNVSLGVYAEIVQSDAYRESKLSTVSEMLPQLLGPDSRRFDLRFAGPDGRPITSAQLVLVSNNPYRLERLAGFGTRARLDTGLLGIAAVRITGVSEVARLIALEAAGRVSEFPGWVAWSAKRFEVDSGGPIDAGVDGEATSFDPPLVFEMRPRALRVRIASRHPGLSPAAAHPGLSQLAIVGLVRMVAGHPSGIIG